ncbi:MAG: tRNA 2-thiouridine synthesizing protein A [Natrialbaceae archaeon]|jgi:tRNA 2-thiouridine synthesizing protein A
MREEIDVTGEVCPRPALMVRDSLEALGPGDELVVTGDYPPAEENIQRTCKKHGYTVTKPEMDDDNESFRLQIFIPDESLGPTTGE